MKNKNMDMVGSASIKGLVRDFWNEASCGEALYLHKTDKNGYMAQSEERYRLEPFIPNFADFKSTNGKRVLEIGVGLGADHQRFAEANCELFGIDLTERAIEHSRRRLELFGLTSNLKVSDAENLDFPTSSFDLVYSYGVLHHSPNTSKAVSEVYRVLKNEGCAKIMIYHKWSMVGLMLWVRYGLLTGRPWRSLEDIYAQYLESPGTKAYSVAEAHKLFKEFSNVKIEIILGHGDLLTSNAGQRHKGALLSIVKKIWPRWFIRKYFSGFGLFMLIEARK